MELTDFINRWAGTKIDFDGHYGAQCVDLYRQYCKDVLQIPHTGLVEGAKDIYLNYDRMLREKWYFDRIPFSESLEMKLGDVVIWGKSQSNEYGHVAIFISKVDNEKVLVFEQDGFRQDGAKLRLRKAENILGILRCKKGADDGR